jgi:hypothetical protein
VAGETAGAAGASGFLAAAVGFVRGLPVAFGVVDPGVPDRGVVVRFAGARPAPFAPDVVPPEACSVADRLLPDPARPPVGAAVPCSLAAMHPRYAVTVLR